MKKPATNRTKLETLQALEECLCLATELSKNIDLPSLLQSDVVEKISYVRDLIQSEIYAEQDALEHDWQLGFGEINFRPKG